MTTISNFIVAAALLVLAVAVWSNNKATLNFMEAQTVMYRTVAVTTSGACEIIDKLWREREAQP